MVTSQSGSGFRPASPTLSWHHLSNKLHEFYKSQWSRLSGGLPNRAPPPSKETVRGDSSYQSALLTVKNTGKGPGPVRVPGAAACQGSAKWRALQSINPAHLPRKPGRLSDGANWRLIYKHGFLAFTSLVSPVGGK